YVPQHEESRNQERRHKRTALASEQCAKTFEGCRQPKDEQRRQGDEKTVDIRRQTMSEPIARDEVIKSYKSREQISGYDPVALPEQQQSQQGRNQDWCPGQKPVVGGEEHILQRRGAPEPLLSIPEPKRIPVDDPARDQRGQERNGGGIRIQSVRSKQPPDSRDRKSVVEGKRAEQSG